MKLAKVSQRHRRLKDDGALTDVSAHLEARSWEEVAQAGKEDLLMSRRASGDGGVSEDPAEAVGAQNGHAPDRHHSGGRGGRRVQELSHFCFAAPIVVAVVLVRENHCHIRSLLL